MAVVSGILEHSPGVAQMQCCIMPTIVSRGVFITLEGPEGSGKSTHIRLLANWLKARGHRVLVTREPGGTGLAKTLRKFLLHAKTPVAPLAELLLYEADRAQHVSECILPALKRGRVVLCDRFTDSTMAYQGFGRGLDRKLIETLNRIASYGRRPDLTILMDVPADRGLRQALGRNKGRDRLEQAGSAFHRRVRDGFLRIARKERRRFRVVRQQRDIEHTQKLVREAIANSMRG
jgi:dTMP kinase